MLVASFLVIGLSACSPYQLTVNDYMMAAPKVSLGMSKSEVLSILQPSQYRLNNTAIKQPDMYKKGDVLVEILYFRSGWQSDGITTDDEFTPYLFNDGKLVGKGWVVIGGAKSQGQARPVTHVNTTVYTPPPVVY